MKIQRKKRPPKKGYARKPCTEPRILSERSRINSRKKVTKLKRPAFLTKTNPFNEPLSKDNTKRMVNKKKTDKNK
jgi:hypothetical protein